MAAIVQTNGSHVTSTTQRAPVDLVGTVRRQSPAAPEAAPVAAPTEQVYLRAAKRLTPAPAKTIDELEAEADQYVDSLIAKMDAARYGRGTVLAAVDAVVWEECLDPLERCMAAHRAASLPGPLLDSLTTKAAYEIAAYTLIGTVAQSHRRPNETQRWINRAFAAGEWLEGNMTTAELATAIVEGVH
jgi:hypothetical protein